MELQTISQVTKLFGISTRTLRYYEQIGLLKSGRKEGYSYRVYDENSCMRLKQIIVLRKLRIPLKQIALLLEDPKVEDAIEVFHMNIEELDEEISSLSTIRSILKMFAEELQGKANINVKLDLLKNTSMLSMVDSLTLTKVKLKEEKTMEDLNKADESLRKLTDRDVRIIHIPPLTVAALHIIGSMAELEGAEPIREFIQKNNLEQIYPQTRHFGFNHPDGRLPDGSDHGYERWITIPDHLEVEAPFVKKQFSGGLYAAHMIPMGAFDEWELLYAWATNNEKYEIISGDTECMHGLLEEHLNFINMYKLNANDSSIQIDLLVPMKAKLTDTTEV